MAPTNAFDIESRGRERASIERKSCFGTVREILQTLTLAALAAYSIWDYTVTKQNSDDIAALENEAQKVPTTVTGGIVSSSALAKALNNDAYEVPIQLYTSKHNVTRDITQGNITGTKPDSLLSFHFFQAPHDHTNLSYIVRDHQISHTWEITSTGASPPEDTHFVTHTLQIRVIFSVEGDNTTYLHSPPSMAMEYVVPKNISYPSSRAISNNAARTRNYVNQGEFFDTLPSTLIANSYRTNWETNADGNLIRKFGPIPTISPHPAFYGVVDEFIITGQYSMVVPVDPVVPEEPTNGTAPINGTTPINETAPINGTAPVNGTTPVNGTV